MRPAQRDSRLIEGPDLNAQRWASRHHGVITSDELRNLGFSKSAISRRLGSGILIPIRPRTFRFAATPSTWIQGVYAVFRWLEPRVVVSHRTAARIWMIGDLEIFSKVEVTVPQSRRAAEGVNIHVSPQMLANEVRIRNMIPVTDPTRTCIDCCSVLSDLAAEAVMDDALHAQITTLERLQARLEALGKNGRKGIGRARRLIEKRIREGARPESRLTRRVLNLIVDAHLPIPVSLYEIRLPDGRVLRPDLAYPDLLIAIEADSYKHHGDDGGWRNDIHRDNVLQSAGWIVLRFTWDHVVNRPEYVIETIMDALRGRGAIL